MKSDFPEIHGKIIYDEPLSKHTTFRIGGPCKMWLEPADTEDLVKVLKYANLKNKKIFIIGNGSNILARDKGYTGIMIRLANSSFKNIHIKGCNISVGSGSGLSHLINIACKNGLGGIEGLIGIPGTVGGAVFMNAGYKQDIAGSITELKVIDKTNAKMCILKRNDIKFGYRHSGLGHYIILEAKLKLKKCNKRSLTNRMNAFYSEKRKNQPLGSFSAGCIFRNPEENLFSAGRYIDMLGLKGKRIGGAAISERHANFIINIKNAKAKDVLRLIDFVKEAVRSYFHVTLSPEIKII